ncbi:GspE/PulE family protein [Stenotrophomonas sp. 24(2023)]|uniref:GspE/PulE family protein n=1 Tax=Stenotrophomonas sp. 24(2023) TaxID=3068324 RepID=UPI0027E10D7E|nr:GspE/PulE family protein [Stenotrophomonas sp. 24(2023)]WMJ70173.1 GspE/PulE family protein [Stenotrophomonas sp. 24(2023)]
MTASPPTAVLDAELLRQARSQARTRQQPVISVLQQLLQLPEHALLPALSATLDMPLLDAAGLAACQPLPDLLPLPQALQRGCLLLRDAQGRTCAVVDDPFDQDLRTWLSSRAGLPDGSVHTALARRSDIQAWLSRLESSAKAMEQHVPAEGAQAPQAGRAAAELSFASAAEGGSPAVRLLNSTLYDALKATASDIHLESMANGLMVKYRIDGVLNHAATVQGAALNEQVISRLKVLAELDISERRVPQDGSFRVTSGGRDIDLRVSIMPSIHGEDAVIRVLDKRAMIEAYGALTLEALGFDAPSLASLRQLARQAYGMLLVTGPTGSGKTTTLYAALTEIHDGRDKIITIEDPVEYQLPGILQIPVNEKKGLNFAKGLRSILRHDPDKIMVGEIRDRETAEIAVQSALTGHLVLTTVHANNVFDVFGRFKHMGIDPYSFVSALNGIWAQRLVRLNCPHCATACAAPDAQALATLELTPSDVQDFTFLRGTGCGDCRDTGYKGRHAIAEVLLLDDEIRELVIEQRPIRQIKAAAHAAGTRSLRHAALQLVRQGLTTLEEVQRVTVHA